MAMILFEIYILIMIILGKKLIASSNLWKLIGKLKQQETSNQHQHLLVMRETIIYNSLCKNLGNTPTEDQSEALKKIASYIVENNNDIIFLLTGYAGTGKTSVISSVVRTLDLLRMKSVLLAPTGRAAKVLASFAG
ncbi:MAG TPA: AAA family ATPase, partial [Ignavibacteria bacterium]